MTVFCLSGSSSPLSARLLRGGGERDLRTGDRRLRAGGGEGERESARRFPAPPRGDGERE